MLVSWLRTFRWRVVVLALAVGSALFILIARTGHDVLPVTTWERTAREALERWLVVRPRTKEFMFAYPALFIGLYCFAVDRRSWGWPLLVAGTVAPISVINTFSHVGHRGLGERRSYVVRRRARRNRRGDGSSCVVGMVETPPRGLHRRVQRARCPGGRAGFESECDRHRRRQHEDACTLKVVISGYFGFDNAGDEAILEAMLAELRALRPDVRPVVLSGDPPATEARFDVEAVPRLSVPAVLRALRGASLFISGGGSLLQDATGWGSVPYYAGLMRLAGHMGVPVFVYAQGIGPLRRRPLRALAQRALVAAAEITVRDRQSYETLRKMGVPEDKNDCHRGPGVWVGPRRRRSSRDRTLEKGGLCSAWPSCKLPFEHRARRSLIGIALRPLPSRSELAVAVAEAVAAALGSVPGPLGGRGRLGAAPSKSRRRRAGKATQKIGGDGRRRRRRDVVAAQPPGERTRVCP